MTTLLEFANGLTIGTVESVAPDRITVLLELDAPQATALNNGTPTRFPRLNGYLLIPNETGATVGMITWLGIERSPYPKRPGLKDFGLIDLPFPLRKLHLTPLGTLNTENNELVLQRGITSYPCVGDQVQLPTSDQLRALIERTGKDARLPIGTAPLAGGVTVSVDPDKLFGRHLAVLGNTGSGKSCTVAGLIRWSLERAQTDRLGQSRHGNPNARVIILDPNGEYTHSFDDLGPIRRFQVEPPNPTEQLKVPAWMWNSSEWAAYTQAAPGTQRPLLTRAIREMRSGAPINEPDTVQAIRYYSGTLTQFRAIHREGPKSYTEYGPIIGLCQRLAIISQDAERHRPQFSGEVEEAVGVLQKLTDELYSTHARKDSKSGRIYYEPFSETEILGLIDTLDTVVSALPKTTVFMGASEDTPIFFESSALAEHVSFLATSQDQSNQAAQWTSGLILRIQHLVDDPRLTPIIRPPDSISCEEWLNSYIGAQDAGNGNLAVIDLSLVPTEIVHTVVAVVARLIFEALQRFRKLNGVELPTIVVLEEAHTFIRDIRHDPNTPPTPAVSCCVTFERIAREGRKFGLGLLLSSQRPSELSPTVLAQCNTFLLHRLVNDKDQELVRKLVPDALGGLLGELPSLPTRQAILLGWASPIPILLEVNSLEVSQRPRSADPAFWDTWTGAVEREINWNRLVSDWTET